MVTRSSLWNKAKHNLMYYNYQQVLSERYSGNIWQRYHYRGTCTLVTMIFNYFTLSLLWNYQHSLLLLVARAALLTLISCILNEARFLKSFVIVICQKPSRCWLFLMVSWGAIKQVNKHLSNNNLPGEKTEASYPSIAQKLGDFAFRQPICKLLDVAQRERRTQQLHTFQGTFL